MKSLLVVGLSWLVCAQFGCGDRMSGSGVGLSAGAETACTGTPATTATQQVFEGLKSICAGCHSSGVRGFFGSLTTFQALIVSNPKLVSPGNPGASELVRLLEGTGTGAFQQMPPSGPTYSQLSKAGTVKLSVAQVTDWIKNLGAQQRDPAPDPNAPHISRLGAREMQRTLYQQLGLGPEDFFTLGMRAGAPLYDTPGERYAIQSQDDFPATFERDPADRFIALGGGSPVKQVTAQPTVSPTVILTLNQVSQAWCRLALAKSGNQALFPTGTQMSLDPVTVKAALKRWFTHFLAVAASDAEVAALHDGMFAKLAAKSGMEPAWVGACSYFIRHPLWTFY